MHALQETQFTDQQLLRQYAEHADQRAFSTLVQRHVRLVYSAAARRLGQRDLAEDVSQVVFILLARKAKAVSREPIVSRWLLSTVRYVAANATKTETRRRRREQTIAMQQPEHSKASADPSEIIVWQEAATMLDDAVLKLRSADRDVLLLRYFQEQPIAQIAAALQTTEGAVKQRLARAIDHLRKRLGRRDVVAAMLGADQFARLLQIHAVKPAPPGLSDAAASAAVHGARAANVISLTKGAMHMMRLAQIKLAAVVAVAVIIGSAGGAVALRRTSDAGVATSAASKSLPVTVPPPPTTQQTPAKPVSRINIGDEIVLHFRSAPDYDADYEQHVDRNGTIMFSELGWITAAGQTPAQVVAQVQHMLADKGAGKFTVTINVKPAPPAAGADTINLGDALHIQIWDLAGPGNDYYVRDIGAVVDPDGTVELPMIGPIRLAGDTEQRAITQIIKAYEDASIVMNPRVTVLRTGRWPGASQQGGTSTSHAALQTPVVLRSGDELLVNLWDLYEIGSQSVLEDRIDGDGTMTFPLVGPIKLAGLTEWQAMQKIAKVFSDKQILTNMQDTVQRIAAAPSAASTSPSAPQPPIVLRSGDRLNVELVGVYKPASDTWVRDQISDDGTLNFPLVGHIKLTGLTKWQAMQKITKAYADKRNATVTPWLQVVPPGSPYPTTQP